MHLSKISLALRQWGAAGFSPLSLFASGEQGAWYDPSDLTTMFQDSAGTTPVTADGQPVGLILDKSQGLALGPELITNAADRDFSSDTGFWTKEGSATISGGVVNINNPTTTASIYKLNFPNEPSGYYEIAFDLTLTAGQIEVLFGLFRSSAISTSGRKVVRMYRATVGTFGIRTVGATTATGTIDNLTIKRVLGNHASQATAASRPLYKTDGTYHWLQFDGVDDSLSTAAIDFTGTDKVSVFSGLKKNADAAAIVLELSESPSNQGMFYLVSGEDAGSRYSSLSKGSMLADFYQAAFWAPSNIAPDTAVIVASHDIANDLSRIRRNAVYGTNGTGDKGTGNFGNYPLFIGSRAGNSALFNGNIYSLIIRGALSSTQEITDTETWVAGKTGVTL